MLSSLKFKLETKDKIIGYHSSSIFQGVLMEKLSKDTVFNLHSFSINPYCQYVIKIANNSYWTLNGLNNYAFENIIKPLINLEKIYLKNKDLEIKLNDLELHKYNKHEFTEKFLFGNSTGIFNLKFITPTSFKSQGRYIIMPDCRLIFQSLMKKFDATGEDKLFSEELLKDLENFSYISKYRLRSCLFPLEKIKIPAFIGDIQIKLDGPKELRNIASLLLNFGTYSGVGIKTAMGMGAMKIER
ncbi:MAG: CRISPR-associated endoribonuclease Cas6 [Tissierellia bacterium]|nr:CRISPR-associated endoribonuclease Cas6 [Tissierellia bacterium]